MRLTTLIWQLFACIALLLPGRPLHAADTPGTYAFRSYGSEHGLRNQAVTGLAQDLDGFIFAATEDGLFRYDGHRFERFGTEHGLLGNNIAALYREPGGRLWVIDSKGALAWSGNRPDPSFNGPILPNREIESMVASDSGYLLISTTKGVYEGRPGKLVLVEGLPRARAGAVWISADGRQMLAAAKGQLYRRGADGAWQARALPPGYQNEAIHTIMIDAQDRIWIRGRRVLLRLASFEGAIEDLAAQVGASVQKGQLIPDLLGHIWTPTNLGPVRFDDKGAWLLSTRAGLPTQWASILLIDREGNLWVASEGLHRQQGRLLCSAHTQRQELPSDTVWNIRRDRAGELWAGTNRGLARATGKQWVTLPGTENRLIYALAEDEAGNFWAAGSNAKKAGNTLLMRPAGSGAFGEIALSHLDGPSTVLAINFGPDQALYVGTQAHGLHRVARSGAGYASKAVALPNGTPTERINQVLRDAKGRLWVSGEAGLAYYDGIVWRRFGKADGLRDVEVGALAIEPDGQLLVGYYNINGLTRFRVNDQGLAGATQIEPPAALVADYIYSLGYDARGALWLGTAQGVKRWKDGRLEQFGRGEGLPSEDSNTNAFWADPNGDVWVGLASGLAHFHADAELPPPPPPATRVMRIQNGAGATLNAPVPKVEWANRALTFHFAVLGYTNENKIHSQVRLAGFEDAWRDTDLREARYTGLPAGKFRFEVRAAMGPGPFGPVSMREVVVLAPWWLTLWAMALYAVGLGTALILLMRWRMGLLNRRNTELEALVRARTDALEKANQALQEASVVDPLTGLKNRRFLGLAMPDELARVQRQLHAGGDANTSLLFYMIDLDHFKAVNDTYGHAAGDLVLRQTSVALSNACRDADFVVRWGGEEFLIVARNADRGSADLLANNLLAAVRDLHIDIGHGVVLRKTCSVGFAAFPLIDSAPEAHSWEDVVKMADQCLYAAKHSGRDAWVGVAPAAGAADPGPRMADQLGVLAGEGRVQVISSLPAGTVYRWQ